MACDVDVRAALLQNIVVVGNSSLTRGLVERLDLELAGLLPSVYPLLPFPLIVMTDIANSKRSRSIHRQYRLSGNTRPGSVGQYWRVWERSISCG